MQQSRSAIPVQHGAAANLAVLAAVLLFFSACEKSPETKELPSAAQQLEGESYGDGVKRDTSISIAEILADPAKYEGKTVRVEGTVTDVCPMRGCWFEMVGSTADENILFKVNDGVMVFPMTAVGKHAVAEGVVRVKELSLEETRGYAAHLAEEKGEPFDPATITEPKTLVQLAGTGAVIRD